MDSVIVGPKANGHLLLLSIPAWGCLRPLCALAAKVVQARDDVVVTYLTFGDFDHRIKTECYRYIPKGEEAFGGRFRFVNIGGHGFGFDLMPVIIKNFPGYYASLVRCEPVRCSSTGVTFPPVLSPTYALTDFNFLPVLQAIRAVTGKKVPVLHFFSCSGYYKLRIFGPEKYGGMGDRPTKIPAYVEGTDRERDEILKKIVNMDQGELVNLPGFPPFYDYEWYSHPLDKLQFFEELPSASYSVFATGHKFVEECDGFVYTSGEAYEPGAIHATRQWLKESGNRPLYAVGPFLPPGAEQLSSTELTPSVASEHPTEGTEPLVFMHKILTTHGKESLFYLSFGSMWWPSGGYAQIFVEVLLELRIPFIFAIASPHMDIPPEFINNATATGLAMFSKWAPQQTILSHPVTGWVLTHCGQNTVLESLAQGKPMIAWPLTFDQPPGAAHMSLTLDVAFELVQVRQGEHGLKPLYRGVRSVGTAEAVKAEVEDVLKRLHGEEGARKRRNAKKVRDEFRAGWQEDGAALRDFRNLLSAICDPNITM